MINVHCSHTLKMLHLCFTGTVLNEKGERVQQEM